MGHRSHRYRYSNLTYPCMLSCSGNIHLTPLKTSADSKHPFRLRIHLVRQTRHAGRYDDTKLKTSSCQSIHSHLVPFVHPIKCWFIHLLEAIELWCVREQVKKFSGDGVCKAVVGLCTYLTLIPSNIRASQRRGRTPQSASYRRKHPPGL